MGFPDSQSIKMRKSDSQTEHVALRPADSSARFLFPTRAQREWYFYFSKGSLITYFWFWNIWDENRVRKSHVTIPLAHVWKPQGTPAMSGDKPGLSPLLCDTDVISSYSLSDSSQENFPHTSCTVSPISTCAPSIKAFTRRLLCAEGGLCFTLHSANSLITRVAQTILPENVLCLTPPSLTSP